MDPKQEDQANNAAPQQTPQPQQPQPQPDAQKNNEPPAPESQPPASPRPQVITPQSPPPEEQPKNAPQSGEPKPSETPPSNATPQNNETQSEPAPASAGQPQSPQPEQAGGAAGEPAPVSPGQQQTAPQQPSQAPAASPAAPVGTPPTGDTTSGKQPTPPQPPQQPTPPQPPQQPTPPQQSPTPPSGGQQPTAQPQTSGMGGTQPPQQAAPQKSKSKKKLLLFIAIPVLVALTAAGVFLGLQVFGNSLTLADYEGEKFSISYPEGYEQEEDDQSVVFSEPLEEGQDEDTQSQVIVYYYDIPQNLPQEQRDLFRSSYENLSQTFKDTVASDNEGELRNVDESDTELIGEPAERIKGDLFRDGSKLGDFVLISRLTDNDFIMLAVAGHVDDPEISANAQKIIDSFQIKN